MNAFVRVNIYLKSNVEWNDDFIDRFKFKSITLSHLNTNELKKVNIEKIDYIEYNTQSKYLEYLVYINDTENKKIQEYLRNTNIYIDDCHSRVISLDFNDSSVIDLLSQKIVYYYDFENETPISLTESFSNIQELSTDEKEYVKNEAKKQNILDAVTTLCKKNKYNTHDEDVYQSLAFITLLMDHIRHLSTGCSIIEEFCCLVKNNEELIDPINKLIYNITGLSLDDVIKKVLE